jgi:hypothetical protein
LFGELFQPWSSPPPRLAAMEHPPPRIVSFVHSIDSQIPPTFILAAPPAPASSAIPGEPQIMFSSSSAAVAANPLKRLASSTSFESSIDVGMSRKRIKSQPNIQYDAPVDGHSPTESTPSATPAQSYQSPKGKGKSDDSQFADSLYEELKCGCCTELCYNVSACPIIHPRYHDPSIACSRAPMPALLLWKVCFLRSLLAS